jgi:outer membrane protein TolC
MKHRIILFFVVVFSIQSSYAQETKTLTLKEAIELSLNYNKQLKLNKDKILEASTAVKEAYERQLPDAGVSGSYLYLPVKANIDLKAGSSNGSSPSVSQVAYGTVNVSVPLYAGGKIKYGIESAKYLEEAIKADVENDRESVILNVTYACINLYKAYTAIGLVKENLSTAQQRVKDFSNLEKNGLLARNDLMKAELQTSNIELTLLDAETNYKLAYVNMDLMMGLPEQTILVPDKNGLTLPTAIKTLEEYETDAYKSRYDITALSYRKKAAGVGVKIANANKYPSIAFTGGYIAADIPNFLTVYNAVNVGIGIKYNIGSLWKTKTKIEQAKLKVSQIQTNEEMLNDNIKLQVIQAYETYLVSVKKIEVYEKSVLQATENYRITKNKYDNALANTTDLLDADVALLQAKLSVTNSKADSFLAYNKLLQTTGTLKY